MASSAVRAVGLFLCLAGPGLAETALVNGDFASGDLTGWTPWVVRNNGGDFGAGVAGGELTLSGTDFQAGVYQRFETGGPGTVVDVIGTWRSNPAVADAMWAEVWVINGGRTPAAGVAETDGVNGAILLYRNDTMNGRGVWNGGFPQTSPVKYQTSFVAASYRAMIVLSTGNTGPAIFSDATFDGVSVSRVAPPATLGGAPGELLATDMPVSDHRHGRHGPASDQPQALRHSEQRQQQHLQNRSDGRDAFAGAR